MWLYRCQTRRLALGADQNDRSPAGGTAVAGDGNRDLVGGQRRVPGRSGPADAHAGRTARHAYCAAAGARAPRAAGHQLLSTRAVAGDRGLAEWSGDTAGPVAARALAEKS